MFDKVCIQFLIRHFQLETSYRVRGYIIRIVKKTDAFFFQQKVIGYIEPVHLQNTVLLKALYTGDGIGFHPFVGCADQFFQYKFANRCIGVGQEYIFFGE